MANLAHIMHGNGHVGNLLRLGPLADANCSIRVHTNPLASNAPVEYAQEEELRLHRPSALVAEQVVRVVDGREKSRQSQKSTRKDKAISQPLPLSFSITTAKQSDSSEKPKYGGTAVTHTF